MDYVQFITTVGTVVSTTYIFKCSLDKKFDEIKTQLSELKQDTKLDLKSVREDLKNHSDRLSKIEGEMSSVRSMLHALVGSLTGHKTGTTDA